MSKTIHYPGSFLQSEIWGAFRESLGWHAHKAGDILILERSLPLGKTLLYSPEVTGPPEILLTLLPQVFQIAKRRNSIFYRLEILLDQNDPVAERWHSAFVYTGLRKSFESVQPEDRQVIALNHDEHKVLAAMKQKGRYNIRLAEKKGVMVRESSPKTLESDVATFYRLFQETGKRDHFAIRPLSYFLSLCQTLYQHECGRLFIATHEGTPLAAAIITNYQGVVSYLYGASSSQKRGVMAPYALHWSVIQWAISQKATLYDLLAIRPEGPKKHAYDGITRFKQQFGGEAVPCVGSWDLLLQPTWYNLFKAIERVRR